jgi:hypothetical protein
MFGLNNLRRWLLALRDETVAKLRHDLCAAGLRIKLLEARCQTIELRASKAEKDADDLRTALADERHEHDKTKKSLEASDEQNEHLWDIVQRDRARVAAEIAIHNRRKAQAETDSKRPPEDETS